MELNNKQILVVGLGKSGFSSARFLHRRGAQVTVTDMAPVDALPHARQLMELGIRMELEQHDVRSFTHADLVVLSPGVPHTIGPLEAARRKGVPVVGEIELASWFVKEPILAITGTNGKTTTTELLGQMLEASAKSVFVGGNIGRPFIEYVSGGQQADRVVLEISSFQLDTIESFRPHVGVLLNITDDHLDRYPSLNAYAQSKGRLFKNQTADDVAIFKAQDARIKRLIEKIPSRKLPFYSCRSNHFPHDLLQGAMINQQVIHVRDLRNQKDKIQLSEIRMPGKHNQENVAAASLAALACGGSMQGILKALKTFKGLPHRLEFIDTVNRISFFNDSKATNVDAVLQALTSFQNPLILIAGGRDKGGDFQLLKDAVHPGIKNVILLGESKKRIAKQLEGTAATQLADSMQEAVFRAFAAAEPGDTVLLSPGCASFDMYPDYKARGDDFRAAVAEIKRKER